ncbi:MAG TPA: sensor histidine kinase KdpD [Vicinamibacteria bacterium]|nr:sensor histidine kinase KdpD [Vicinamibacteria bacterium]
MTEERPDPDALLRRLAAEEAPKRGRLKVFFGAAPGVGKTYAMLEAARGRRAEGVDVVIGWIETHGRAETAALTDGLERVAPRALEYRGVSLREFDLDAALARRPALILLDELAHTNASGSRHAKRWHDTLELLEAGIDVYTTLNVQHLESLNDLVNQVTGVVVRETVPDRVLDDADDVEFVDLPPDDLLKRLAEGKVYLPDRAAQAVKHFFRRGNLHALRELALRRTAEHVDADVRAYRRDHEIEPTWPVAERILVCVRPNPESDRLVRAARRMAARLKAPWIVAYVEDPTQPPLSAEERKALGDTLRLAEELGAETVSLSGGIAETLLDFARQRNVSRIVIGKPVHSRLRDRLKGSLLDEIVRGSAGIEVMVIPGGQALGKSAPRAERSRTRGYAWAVGTVLACTLLCWAMFRRFDNSNLIMVYLLGVAFVAARHGRRPSVLAAVLSVAAFDFFFVPPYLTFAVSDTQYVITFAVMLGVSLLISTLAVRVKAQAEDAARRGQRTQALYDLTRELATATAAAEIARVTSRHVSDLLRGPAELLLPEGDGRLAPALDPGMSETRETAVAQWVFEHGRPAGRGTETLPGAAALYLPLRGAGSGLGVLGVQPDEALQPLAPDQMELLETLAHQAASNLERVRHAAEAEQARVAAETERLRSTLLSSVSHDLRTPLAAITGAASSLVAGSQLSDGAEAELKQTILEESERLNRLVGNLLDMTQLESGTLKPRKEWHSLEEVVGSALARFDAALDGRDVRVRVAEDVPLVAMDPTLVEQVLVNLLDNALKHTPPGTAIAIEARLDAGAVRVEVADEGPGLPAGTEERVFEKFFRGASDSRGFGLGLPICRAIVTAHGGRIWAEARPSGGAAFVVTLPAGEAPPLPPAEADERLD